MRDQDSTPSRSSSRSASSATAILPAPDVANGLKALEGEILSLARRRGSRTPPPHAADLAVRPAAVIYVRQSEVPGEQKKGVRTTEHTLSAEAQIAEARECIARAGGTLGTKPDGAPAIYVDEDVKGWWKVRNEFDRMRADVAAANAGGRRRVDRVYFFKISRFGRKLSTTLEVAEELAALGVDLYSVKEGLLDRTKLLLLGAVAEIQTGDNRDHVASTIRQRRRQGKKWGRPAYGLQDVDGERVHHPARAATVRRIFARYRDGATLTEIARELDADPAVDAGDFGGIARRGWSFVNVRLILENRIYVGDVELPDGEVVPKVVPPILVLPDGSVDVATWNAVQRRLAACPQRRRRKERVSFLEGRIVCACGETRFLQRTATRDGAEYYYWCCRRSQRAYMRLPATPAPETDEARAQAAICATSAACVGGGAVEEIAFDVLLRLVAAAPEPRRAILAARTLSAARNGERDRARADLERERARLREKAKREREMYGDQLQTRDELDANLAGITARLAAIETELLALPAGPIEPATIEAAVASLRAWAVPLVAVRRARLESAQPGAVVGHGGGRGPVGVPADDAEAARAEAQVRALLVQLGIRLVVSSVAARIELGPLAAALHAAAEDGGATIALTVALPTVPRGRRGARRDGDDEGRRPE